MYNIFIFNMNCTKTFTYQSTWVNSDVMKALYALSFNFHLNSCGSNNTGKTLVKG